jgi:hypothetical protein
MPQTEAQPLAKKTAFPVSQRLTAMCGAKGAGSVEPANVLVISIVRNPNAGLAEFDADASCAWEPEMNR